MLCGGGASTLLHSPLKTVMLERYRVQTGKRKVYKSCCPPFLREWGAAVSVVILNVILTSGLAARVSPSSGMRDGFRHVAKHGKDIDFEASLFPPNILLLPQSSASHSLLREKPNSYAEALETHTHMILSPGSPAILPQWVSSM